MSVSDDSALYTGVDGIFGNEGTAEPVKEVTQEQDRLLTELVPHLEELIALLDEEKDLCIKYIADKVDEGWTEADLGYEAKAAGRYRKYLDGLKTKFTLRLPEDKR